MTARSTRYTTPWRRVARLSLYPPYLLFGVFFFVGITSFYVLPLLPGLIVRQIFDSLTSNAYAGFNRASLFAMIVGVAIANTLMISMSNAAETSMHAVINTLLRRNILARVLAYPGAKALPESPGEAISRLRDDVGAIPNFMTLMVDPVGQIITTVIGIFILGRVGGLLALSVILPILAAAVLVHSLTRLIQRYRRASHESIAGVTSLIGEAFRGVQAIKLAGTGERVVSWLEGLNEARRKANLRDIVLSQIVWSLNSNTAAIATGIVLIVAARGLHSHRLSVGDLAIFVSYVGHLGFVISAVGGTLMTYRQVGVSFSRLVALLPGEPEESLVRHAPVHLWGHLPPAHVPPAGVEPLVELSAERLSYRYPGSDRGITDIDLRLEQGSVTVVTGRIGSGKTTLLRVLLGLLPRDSGRIRWNGSEVGDPGDFFVPPRSAYAPQVPHLFSETLRDNVLMGLESTDVELERALRAAVLDGDVPFLEQGLDTVVGPRGAKLSGGQVQRAAAARMLARGAELLVIDDLSSSLDVDTEQLLWKRLLPDSERRQGSVAPDGVAPGSVATAADSAPAGAAAQAADRIPAGAAAPAADAAPAPNRRTFLIVSNRRAPLLRADRIIVMKNGRIEDSGRLAELLERSAEMRALWATNDPGPG